MAKFVNQIVKPFAAEGLKTAIPETPPEDNSVNQTQGFTPDYQKNPVDGGKYIDMSTINQAFYDSQSAIKEVQDKAVLSVNYAPPDEDGNVTVDMEPIYAAINSKQPTGDYATNTALNSHVNNKNNPHAVIVVERASALNQHYFDNLNGVKWSYHSVTLGDNDRFDNFRLYLRRALTDGTFSYSNDLIIGRADVADTLQAKNAPTQFGIETGDKFQTPKYLWGGNDNQFPNGPYKIESYYYPTFKSNLNIPLMPTSLTWKTIVSGGFLPAGGTWACAALYLNNSAIYSGGTQLPASAGVWLCWKIA